MLSSEDVDQGPDRVLPAENLSTSEIDGCVQIRKTKEWPANRDPMSLPTFFRKQCESGGSHPALAVKRNDEWVKWNYNEYLEDVVTTAKAFIALGLERHESVCIFGFNSPEWVFSSIGTIFAGGKVSKIYRISFNRKLGNFEVLKKEAFGIGILFLHLAKYYSDFNRTFKTVVFREDLTLIKIFNE